MKNLLEVKFKLIFGVLVSILALVVLTYFSMPDGNFHAYFLDIGQGDSILIQTPSKYNILVDGGPGQAVLGQVGKKLPFWDKKIDLVVATNPDKDHINGLNFILESYQVGKVWLPEVVGNSESYNKLLENIEKYHVQTESPRTADSLTLADGTQIEVLWPRTKKPQVPTINEGSIVFVLKYQDFSLLMTGDAESTTQPYPDLAEEIDVLKVPHHGSKSGVKPEYLQVLSPAVSVISVGKKNAYGHPDPNTVQELEKSGSSVLATADHGTIEVVSDGKSWYTRTER